ncbi:MAG: nucleotidyltransferase family protein [Campylobacterota bacterium]|nr:nucleotidyltransferase family protein [Campylobacterota bacterium]
METQKEILNFLKEHKYYLEHHFHVKTVGLFGSFARNEQTKDSDVDLLIDFNDDITKTFTLKQSLRQYFSDAFGRGVDIASEKFLKPYVKEYILKDVLYV